MWKLLSQLSPNHLVAIFMSLALATFSYFGQVPPVLAQTVQPQILASLFSFSGTRPDNLGVTSEKLAECPTSPNCVSSQSADLMHQIEPLSYDESGTEAFENLKTLIENLDNSKIITAEDRYLYAEFSTPIMGFVDDVEFFLDQEDNIIHVRSASRLGESDLGVNRNRIETIRSLFNT